MTVQSESKGSIPPHRFEYEAQRSLNRVKTRLLEYQSCCDRESALTEEQKREFSHRLESNWREFFRLLYELYGFRFDFHYHLEQIILTAYESYASRPAAMLEMDAMRERDPLWYRRETMLGGALYVDLFADTILGLKEKIPYLKEMGFTYIHLMPLFKTPNGENDGGYAVSDYRNVEQSLGTIEDLKSLADAFRAAGISLVVDFIFNHTADDHEWAKKAQSGEVEFEDYYHIYPTREMPDRFDRTLREIFPTVRRGSFSWQDGIRKWVWTTFNDYQWDLRYANPDVFRGMMQEMLFLSNLGVEILRLDAVAFVWKEEGTVCENLDEAHLLIRAFNAVARIAAPSLLFKSEAIVHPDDVVKYIDGRECQLSYNPLLMATIWEATATRNASLLVKSIEHRHQLPEACNWCNYLRGHDDIGWTFDDGDAANLGINGFDHRKFLNQFYSGEFEGSFSKGVPFQYNPETQDMRVCGTLASLAGVEQALESGETVLQNHAVERICMMHSIILSIGGIPLLYLGDEWGTLNDYGYIDDPRKIDDSRWVHRIRMHWDKIDSPQGLHLLSKTIRERIRNLLNTRKNIEAFAGVDMELLFLDRSEILSYVREHSGDRVIVIQNIADREVECDAAKVVSHGPGHHFIDLLSNEQITIQKTLKLKPYQHLWLRRN